MNRQFPISLVVLGWLPYLGAVLFLAGQGWRLQAASLAAVMVVPLAIAAGVRLETVVRTHGSWRPRSLSR